MGQITEPNLPEEAQRLLGEPFDPEAMVTLGVACHGQMLELGEDQRPEAIRHALAGAALFAALQEQAEPAPSWLNAYEEQCCRNGAIWINDQLRTANCLDPHWSEKAIKLLQRMEQLHPAPIPWAAMMRAELASRAAAGTNAPGTSSGAEHQCTNGAVLFTPNAWEPGIRSELESYELTFSDFRSTDLSRFKAIIPLCLDDQHYINALLPDNPSLPALVPSESCIELCHDKEDFIRHLHSLNLGECLTPNCHQDGFPYILKPKAGEWGVDTIIITNNADEILHASKIDPGKYYKEHYIASNQECSSHIIMSANKIRFMGSVRFTFDTDFYVKGINKSPIAMEMVDHSQFAPVFERILASINYEGICCFDYKIANGKPCIFELNPRYGASMTAFIQQALPIYCQVLQERRGFARPPF